MSIILHSVTRWNYIPKNLYEMQFLLLIGTHCAGGCIMDSRKEWFMPRIQVYKVNKMWFLWSVFSCLSKLQFSHSLQCSSPHHFGCHWHVEGFRYAFLLVGVIPDSLWKRRESPAVPMTATAPGRTQGNVCCIPRIWERVRRHICHVTATDSLLHLLVQPTLFYVVITRVCLSQSTLAGHSYFQGH